ncbi:MAG: S8 family serine peptidase [Candidatus Heimdallarchaeaceae archaeon]
MKKKKIIVLFSVIFIAFIGMGCFLTQSSVKTEQTSCSDCYENIPQMTFQNTEWKYYCSEDTLDWGVDEIDAEKVWGFMENSKDVLTSHYAGRGVKLCIIDTGIDRYHQDLSPNYKGGIDFVNGGIPEDLAGHGTACAGIIAAADNEWGTIGVAPEVDLYMARNGESVPLAGLTYDSINWAIDNRMDVISMSFGGGNPDISNACAKAYKMGIILVAASGNDYCAYVSAPARYKSVIAVGAAVIDPEDNNKFHLWHGPGWGTNHGSHLELLAPGGSNINTTDIGNSFQSFGMTSAATPHVAGICALILEAKPDLFPGEIRHILRESARTDCFSDGLTPFDTYHGFGLVNAEDAIDYAINTYQRTDTDGDGLYDVEEIMWGTIIDDTDTDDDGMPDGWEFRNLLEPLDPGDYDDDPDGDGLTNLLEYLHGSDPNEIDSDNDGLTDGDEVNIYNTSPSDTDSDGDTMPDGWEVSNGLNPASSSDKYQDPDGEGLQNFMEYTLGTDPNDPDTDNDYMTDQEEFDWAFDPLDDDENHNGVRDDNDDFDYDGLTNKEEIKGWFDSNDDGDYNDAGEKSWYVTDPNDSDTDDDGWDDYLEQHPLPGYVASNPNDPLSTPSEGGGFFFP